MDLLIIIVLLILLTNLAIAIAVVFKKPREISSTWAWLLVLIVFPGLGIILYLYTGRGLNVDNIYKINQNEKQSLENIFKEESLNTDFIFNDYDQFNIEEQEIMQFFKNIEDAPLIKGNDAIIFDDGPKMFASMIEDFEKATKSIHVQFFAIKSDGFGTKFRDLLVKKASEGIEVIVVYDQIGSKVKKDFWKPLFEQGGKAVRFITSQREVVRFRANYRNHRKIVIIDSKIGYIGGYNVADQYVDKSSYFKHWRDTHLRIIGNSVLELQLRFLKDYNASVSNNEQLGYSAKYFPLLKENPGDLSMQIVSSSPSISEETIKLGYIKLFNSAKKRIWIQTPYLIPDESVISSLKLASITGLDVRIMIPCMPDHPFVYRATQFYSQLFYKYGIKIYIYNPGFLHAKTVLIDDNYISIGSANQDIRSYALNFETNAFIQSNKLVNEYEKIYLKDIEDSTLLTQEMIDNQSRWLKIKQKISRLLSPVL